MGRAGPSRRRTLLPNDTLFSAGGAQGPAVGQWYLRAPAGEVASSINAATAWDTTTGSASVMVAVLDTGVRSNHPRPRRQAARRLRFRRNERQAAIANDGDGRDADPSDPGDWLTQPKSMPTRPFWDGCEPSSQLVARHQVGGIIGAATDNGAGMAGAAGTCA